MSAFEDRIEIREQIDSDGWFVFYRAVERASGKNLVVCRPAPEMLASSSQAMERFHGRLAMFRGAEFVVTESIVDGDVDATGPVFATNEFEGMRLSERVGALSQRDFKQIAERLCKGLAEIHGRGVAHGCLSIDVVRVAPMGTGVCLGGVMRTVFAGVVEDASGRSMRQCDLAQLAVILAEVLEIELDQVDGLAAGDPNAAFLQLLLRSGFQGGLADAEQALIAAQELPSEAPDVATPAPPPQARPLITAQPAAPAAASVEPIAAPTVAAPPVAPTAAAPTVAQAPAVTQSPGVKLATGPAPEQQAPPSQPQQANVTAGAVNLTSPTADPVGGVTIPKKNNKTKYVLGGVGFVVLAIIGFLVMSHLASRNAEEKREQVLAEVSERFEEARLGEQFVVSEEEFEILLSSLKGTSADSGQSSRLRIVQAATCEDSARDGELIFEAALSGDCSDQVRSQLLSLLKERKIFVEVEKVLSWANKYGEDQPLSLQAAGELIGPILVSEDVKGVLRAVESPKPKVSQFAVSAMSDFLQNDARDNAQAATEIANRFKVVKDSKSRGAYLKLLVAIGSDEALEAAKEAMQGKDALLRSMAFKAVTEWPDDRALDLLVTQIEETTDAKLRSEIFQSLSTIADSKREREDAVNEKAWKAVASAASAEDEKLLVLKSLATRKEEWAFYIVEFFMSDAESKVSQKAESTYEQMETQLQNTKR